MLTRIQGTRLNLSLERAAAAALALCVVCFTLGSSSVPRLRALGQDVRWLALVLLWLVAAALVVRLRRRGSRLRPFAVPGFLAALLVGAMLASTAWSGEPRLTLERAGSCLVLLSAAGGLALGCTGRPAFARLLAWGLVTGVGVVLLGGFLFLLAGSDSAAQPAGSSTPWRFRGIGENPNTVPMLAALGIPLAVAVVAAAQRRREALAGAAVLALAVATIALSGSRGALLAALVGALVVAAQLRPRRVAAVVAAASVALSAGCVVVSRIPQPASQPASQSASQSASKPASQPASQPAVPSESSGGARPGTESTPPPPPPPTTGGGVRTRLEDELGSTVESSRRSLFGSSGRVDAWSGAIEQGNERPLLGYGFGTEDKVFFDRFRTFQGDRPENSLIGLYLQLGLVGLGLFLALGVALLVRGARSAPRLGGTARTVLSACLGAFGAGAVLMLFQSYAYAAGNLAALPLWTCAFLLPAAATWAASEPA